MNIYVFGSCRVKEFHKFNENNQINYYMNSDYTHNTKHIIQEIEFIKNTEYINKNEIKYIYPEYKEHGELKNNFDNADMFIIEICSLKNIRNDKISFNIDMKLDSIKDENIIEKLKKDKKVCYNGENLYLEEINEEEINEDFKFIIENLKKPILLVPHINLKTTVYPHKFINSRKLIEKYLFGISKKFSNVYFIDLKYHLTRDIVSKYMKYEEEYNRQGICHYNDNGHSIITKKANEIIMKIKNKQNIFNINHDINEVFTIGTDFIKIIERVYKNDLVNFKRCYSTCWNIKHTKQYIDWMLDPSTLPDKETLDMIYGNFNQDEFTQSISDFKSSKYLIISVIDHNICNYKNIFLNNNYCWDGNLDWSNFKEGVETDVTFKGNKKGKTSLLSYDDFKNDVKYIYSRCPDKKIILFGFNNNSFYINKISKEEDNVNVLNLKFLNKEDYKSTIVLNENGLKKLYEKIVQMMQYL